MESAVIASDLMTWFFVFDDVMDIDHGSEPGIREYRDKLCRRHLEILGGAEATADDLRCILAFPDYLQKAKTLGGQRFSFWYERMTHHLKRWMRGLVDWSARSARYQRLDVDMALQNDALIRQASQKYRLPE